MSTWDLGYVSRREDKASILENGIAAREGRIYLFDDVYYRHNGDFHRRNVCDDVAGMTLGPDGFCLNYHYFNIPYALFHVDRKGLFKSLRQIEIKEPAYQFIWYIEQELIRPQYISFVGFGKNVFTEFTL